MQPVRTEQDSEEPIMKVDLDEDIFAQLTPQDVTEVFDAVASEMLGSLKVPLILSHYFY